MVLDDEHFYRRDRGCTQACARCRQPRSGKHARRGAPLSNKEPPSGSVVMCSGVRPPKRNAVDKRQESLSTASCVVCDADDKPPMSRARAQLSMVAAKNPPGEHVHQTRLGLGDPRFNQQPNRSACTSRLTTSGLSYLGGGVGMILTRRLAVDLGHCSSALCSG